MGCHDKWPAARHWRARPPEAGERCSPASGGRTEGQKVEDGTDVLICHPQLVETGLDLIQFSRVVVYQMIYNPYTLGQCVRRVLRVGQPHDVEVYYPQYGGAFETLAAKLMAMKARSAAQVQGREISDQFMAQAGPLDFQALLQEQIRMSMHGESVTEDELQNIFADAAKARHKQDEATINEYREKFGHGANVVDAEFTVNEDSEDDDDEDDSDEPEQPEAVSLLAIEAPAEPMSIELKAVNLDYLDLLLEAIALIGADNITMEDLFQPVTKTGKQTMPGEVVEQTDTTITFKGPMY